MASRTTTVSDSRLYELKKQFEVTLARNSRSAWKKYDQHSYLLSSMEWFCSQSFIFKFITDIGRTIAEITKNPKSTSFIFQAISMAVQRGNVQCVQGAYGESAFEELDEIFYILQPNCIF